MNALLATSRLVRPDAASSATRSSVGVSSAGARRRPTRSSSARACSTHAGAPPPQAAAAGPRARLPPPGGRAEPLEDVERLAKRHGRRTASLGAPLQTAADEQRPREVERELRSSLGVDIVERGERGVRLPLGREHERTSSRERDLDPQAREGPPALLETLENAPCARDLAERDQRVDVERLASIWCEILRAHRVHALVHPRQRAVSRLVIA